MDVRLLEERLKILRDGNYNVLPLGEAMRPLYEKTLPPRSVVITFDDGGSDFYRRAYPLVKKYNFPTTVYLSIYYCHRSIPIIALACYYVLWKACNTFRAPEPADWGCPANLDLKTVSGIMAAMRSIISNASTLRSDERDQIAERLTRRLNVAYEALLSKRLFQLMNPEEVGRLSADGVDFQLQMHCHRVPMDHDLFVREIKENRQCIPNMTGIEAVHFCYPSGAYRHTFLPWLKEQRIVSATTWGLASPHDHSLLLPRIVNSGAMSPIELESALAGMSAR